MSIVILKKSIKIFVLYKYQIYVSDDKEQLDAKNDVLKT